jgi:hypothetical protein
MFVLLCSLLGLFACATPPVGAQEGTRSVARAGQRVRLTFIDGPRREATLVALGRDSVAIRVCPTCGADHFARADLSALHVQVGLPGTRTQRAIVGAAVGGVGATAATLVALRRCDGVACALVSIVVVPTSIVAGAGLGALVGAAIPVRWRHVLGRPG